MRLAGSPAPKAAKVLKVASRHSVLARKLSTSASVKGAPGAPVLAARAAAGSVVTHREVRQNDVSYDHQVRSSRGLTKDNMVPR